MKEDETDPKLAKWGPQFFESVGFAKPKITEIEMATRLAALSERDRIRSDHFGSRDKFRAFARTQFAYLSDKQFEARLSALADENAFLLTRLSKETGVDHSREPVDIQLMVMMEANYVDPADWFPSVPPSEPLCGLKEMFGHAKDDNQRSRIIANELRASGSYLANRYQVLSGRQLSFAEMPFLAELTTRKAPVPWRTGWSAKWYSAEARFLHHSAEASAAGSSETSTGLGAGEGSGEAVMDEETSSSATSGGGSETNAGSVSSLGACDIDSLYVLAGANPPRQPGSTEPRYTFPGRLNTDEDIFYDYAVILPLKECQDLEPPAVYEPRDFSAAVLLISKTRAVLDFLTAMNLETALGVTREANPQVPNAQRQYFVDDIRSLLRNVQGMQIQQNLDLDTIRFWRRRLKTMAGSLRLIGKTEINLAPLDLPDIEQERDALVAALNAVPDFTLDQTNFEMQEETVDRQGNVIARPARQASYLIFPGAHPDPRGLGYVDLGPGEVRRIGVKWYTDENAQLRHTRWYLNFLGSNFFDSLTNLKGQINQFVTIFDSIKNPANKFREEFERLAIELVYQAIFAIAKLLDEIGENLSLPQYLKEGSKRLAVMLVYRQHWFPAGYVQGKLVGYKNLTPNQSEKVVRRTFVKTTTETSTTEEFAASRRQDYSQSSKETAEFLKETSQKFNITSSASGNFSFAIGGFGFSASSAYDLATVSRSTHSQIAEMTNSGSVSYNEKREVKVREIVEVEDLTEVTSQITNANQEITANYFYYQLLRQYNVVTEMYDIKTVLLRAREVPGTVEVDDNFLALYAHILIGALPPQLSGDLQDTVHVIDGLSRAIVRTRTIAEQKRSIYELKRKETPPPDPQLLSQFQSELASAERAASEAWESYLEAEKNYLNARSRLDRVISHVRQNICFYMQYIWQGSPSVDYNHLVGQEEFGGFPLPAITRGLMRYGFHGAEEIYEYDGPSVACLEVMLRNTRSGKEIVSENRATLEMSSTYKLLARKYHGASLAELDRKISEHIFVVDPAEPGTILNERMVQIAQDALVVETLPGQVPLLEGFKMAHRMLDVQQACLENEHLRARIADRPWQDGAEDSYRVYRREGEAEPAREIEP